MSLAVITHEILMIFLFDFVRINNCQFLTLSSNNIMSDYSYEHLNLNREFRCLPGFWNYNMTKLVWFAMFSFPCTNVSKLYHSLSILIWQIWHLSYARIILKNFVITLNYDKRVELHRCFTSCMMPNKDKKFA